MQQAHRLVLQNSGNNFDAMIERRRVENLHASPNRSALGLIRAINEASNSGLHKRARAHGARLDGHVERRASEAIVARLSRGLAQRHDFCMSRRVAIGNRAIARSGHNPIPEHNNCANGNFSAKRRSLRLHHGQLHVLDIVHGCGGIGAGIKYSTSMTSCSPSFKRE